MELTIKIADESVTFKSTAATIIRYETAFAKSLFKELSKLQKSNKPDIKKGQDIDPNNFDFDNLDFNFFYRLGWIMAKSANKDTPNMEDWLDSFEYFPIQDIAPKILEMLMHSFTGQRQAKKNHPAVTRSRKK